MFSKILQTVSIGAAYKPAEPAAAWVTFSWPAAACQGAEGCRFNWLPRAAGNALGQRQRQVYMYAHAPYVLTPYIWYQLL